LAREDLALTTVRAYHGDLEAFFRWYGAHRIEALTSVGLISYRQYLSGERSLKPASVNRKLEALRRFCRWARTPTWHGYHPSVMHTSFPMALTTLKARSRGTILRVIGAEDLLQIAWAKQEESLSCFSSTPLFMRVRAMLPHVERARELALATDPIPVST
jgi:site-specific recombinase XerD